MSKSTSLVRDQLDLFEKQADANWKVPHSQLMKFYEIKDQWEPVFKILFSFGVSVFDGIELLQKSTSEAVHRGQKPFDENLAREIDSLYARWHDVAKDGFKVILFFRDKQIECEGATAFENAYVRNPAASLNFERVVQASQRAQQGEVGKSLKEVADALQRRRAAGSR